MSRRRLVRRVVFLGLTAVTLGHECWYAWDGDGETEPWTDLIVTHVPGEVTLAVVGALVVWVPWHFGKRYWRKRRSAGQS